MKQDSKILIVDLEGTLIKSEIFLETFWYAFKKDFLIPFKVLFAFTKGKSFLKKYLFNLAQIDYTTLPFNNVIIEYLKNHYSKGYEVYFLSSYSEKIAQSIVQHINISSEEKKSSLEIEYKILSRKNFKNLHLQNYIYIGDETKDKNIWENANKSITFDVNKGKRRNYAKINKNYINLRSPNKSNFLFGFLKAIRPYQWIKNILVFVPILAAQQFDIEIFYRSLFAFFAFSFTASSVYVFNDLLDLKSDRNHPKKRERPFAKGDLSISKGSIGGLLLFLTGTSFGLKIGITFITILSIYYILTIAYSLYFKQKPLLDLCILSGLYTLRIIGGGFATDLNLSFWLLCFSLFNFLSLAAIKRYAELKDIVETKIIKNYGRGYEISDLNFVSFIALSSGLLSSLVLALYINSPNVMTLYPSPKYLWITPFLFLFWILRMCFKTHRGQMDYDPIIFASKDKVSLSLFFLIIISVTIASFN